MKSVCTPQYFKKTYLIFFILLGIYINSKAQSLELVKDLSAYGYTSNSPTIKTLVNAAGETYVYSYVNNGTCAATNALGYYISKYDVNKNCLWFTKLDISGGTTGGYFNELNDMILDNSGNVILNGYVYNYGAIGNIYTVTCGSASVTFPICNNNAAHLNYLFKITSAGTVSWGKTYYEITSSGAFTYTALTSMTADASDNIYLTGEMGDLTYDGTKRTVTNNGNVLLLKINSSGTYSNLVAQSVSAGGGMMYAPKILFNPTSNRLFLVTQATTYGGASGGFAFSNGATIPSDPTLTLLGLYFVSLSTSMAVQSQVYYKSLGGASIYNYNSNLVNSADSVIYLNTFGAGTGSIVFGSNTITQDPTYNKLLLLKFSSSNPSTVVWAKQINSGYNSITGNLVRGQGDNVYLESASFSNIDFGNGVLLNFSGAFNTSFLYQFKASTGASDWVIKIPQTSVDAIRINYSSINSSLFLHIFSSNVDGVPYSFSIYKLNKKLTVTSLTAASTLCPGSTISVNFSSTQTPTAGNVYTLQLSNEEGQFSSYINIGTLTSTALSGAITGTIPAGIEGSPYMKVRVVASNPSLIGAESAGYINVATPNNTRVINTLNNSVTSNVCDQLNITLSPSILYGTTFKWQINTGSGFVDMVNNATYSGVTTGSLAITAAPLSFSGYQYKLLVTNSNCPSVTVTETSTLTVKPRPSVLSVTPVSRCDAGTVSLSATASSGASIRWYNAVTAGSLLSTANPYTTPSISATTTYYADAYLNGCYAFSRVSLLATVYTTPSISSAPAITKCGPTSVTVIATPSAGVVNWYSALTGGTTLYTGTNYVTPVLSANTTYYADVSQNGCTTATRTAVPVTINITPSINSYTNGARCDNGVVNLLATATAGNVLWYTSSTGGTAVFTGTSYSPTLTVTTTYYVDAATTNCTTATRTAVVATVTTTPSLSSVSNGQHCNAGAVVISATPSAGSVNWYTTSTGGTPLATSLSYTTPSIPSTTTYYAEATNNNCNATTRTATVASIFPTPTFTLAKTDPTACATSTGSITVSGLTPFAFYGVAYNGGASTTLPTNGSGVITISSMPSGAYANFTITTSNSCSTVNTAGISLTDPSAPTLTTTSASRCDPGVVTLSASSLATVYWYTQSTGGTYFSTGPTYSPSLTNTTTYYVEASSGSCSSGRVPVTATIYLTPTVTTTSPASICGTGNISIGINYSVGNISWYAAPTGGSTIGTGNSLAIPSLSTTTTYYAEAVNGICPPTPRQAVTAMILPVPSVISTTSGSNCGPGTINLSATPSAGATIQWYTVSSGGTVFSTTANTTSNFLSATTTYYAEAEQGACSSSTRTAVIATINSFPGFTISKIDPSACQVADGSFTLLGLTPNASYTFQYNSVAPQAIVASGTGTYTLNNLLAGIYNGIVVTDMNTCSSMAGSITLVEPGGPSISAGSAQTVCQGDLVTLTSSNPDNAGLTWSTGATTASTSFTASGNSITYYTVIGNLLGCTSKDSVAVKVRSDQTITSFPAISNQTVFSPTFSISATSSSSLPVTFASLDISVATVSGNQVTIVGPGTALIQASQTGNACFNPSPDSIQSFAVTGKLNQVINFGTLPSIAFGDIPFNLGATVNSTNPIIYAVSDPSVVNIVNGNAVGLKAGIVIIKAFALGSTSYNPSDTVIQILNVEVPAFKIFGSTLVQAGNKENYFISPSSPNYSYSWKYQGSNAYYVSDTSSRSVSLFYTGSETSDTLRCRIYSNASNTYVEALLTIKVLPGDLYLPPVNCDSLKSTLTICSGKYINNFILQGYNNDLSSLNSGCDQGYSDYTRLGNSYTTNLYLGNSYRAEVQVGNKSNVISSNYIGLWLDYNNNGSFDDPNEFLISTYSADSSIELKNLLISTDDAFAGIHRLRIRVRSSGLFTFNESCVDFSENGETEDYKISLLIPDRLEAPVLLSPNDDGKNDRFIVKGIYTKPDAGDNKLTIMDRMGNILFTEVNYANTWDGKDRDNKLLPRDTYYYNFLNGDGAVIRGYFEIRYE